MARQDKVATRYARAILEFCPKADKARKVAEELSVFAGCLTESRDLWLALCTELIAAEKRKALIDDLAARLKVSEVTHKVLKMVSNLKRMNQLKEIAERLRLLILEDSGIVPLRVESAMGLDDDEKKKIEKKFEKLLGKDVEANYEVAPELIGGLRVTAGGRTYDGSLAGWLATFEEQAAGRSI